VADFSKLLTRANKFFPRAFHISGEAIHPFPLEILMRALSVVAIIDDEPTVRAAIAVLVASKGYRTEVYASAEEFITHVTQSEAACLVVDVHLGDRTGIELGRHLVSLGYTFPMIFVTGAHDQSLQQQAMALGCIAYLYKPFAPDRLLDAIAKSVGHPKSR
jgi:FixJ family two-component response regulator